MDQLQAQIEKRIESLDPQVELIALERPGGDVIRLFIDHPGGVGLDLCAKVTNQVRDLLSDYAIEVSSPGLDRPLTKPEHYEQFLGHVVRIRTSELIGGSRNFTGRIAAADAASVSLEHDGGRTEIALDRVHRSNLVPELSEVPS
jgi:ribosome maturation factor RimP